MTAVPTIPAPFHAAPRPSRALLALDTESAFEVAARARALEEQGRSVLHLEIGEPDIPTAPHVVEAAVRALRAGRTRYAAPPGIPALRQAVAEALTARGIPATAERVIIAPGGKAALYLAAVALLEPGDEALVPDPGFPIFPSVVRAAGAQPLRYSLDRTRGFALDPDAVAARITPRTRVLVLNAPGNPTGNVPEPGALEAIAALVERHRLTVISDEVYCRVTYNGAAPSLAALPGMAERVVVVDSFSKAYAMTGWRLGYGLFPSGLAEPVTRLVINTFSCTAPFVQEAGVAALTGSQDGLEAWVRGLACKRDRFVAGLAAIPGVTCAPPSGTFFAFPSIEPLLERGGLSSAEFASRLLDEEGVGTLAGTGFGPGGEGRLRLSFAAPEAALDQALERLRRFAGRVG